MFNILKSYFLRTKRTMIRVVMLLCPIIFAGVFSLYSVFTTAIRGMEMSYFFLAYTILACFSISFFVPMLYESDKKAAMYVNDLRCGIDRKKLFFARFLLIIILLIIIELLASVLFLIVLYFYGITVSLVNFALAMLISIISLLPLLPLYQFLSIKFNYSGSILTGAIFTLAAILLGTTNLGEGIWWFLPFVYPVKFITMYVEHSFSLHTSLIFFSLLLFLTLLNLLTFSLWYNKWNGISKMEE